MNTDITPDTIDEVVEFGRLAGMVLPERYDAVISCLGWHHNKSMYHRRLTPAFVGKYPALTPDYESTNVPGVFFAGSLSHGRDAGRAAGGFIHGFRYTAQALVRILLSAGKGTAPGQGWDPLATRIFHDVGTWDGRDVGVGLAKGQAWSSTKSDGSTDQGLTALLDHVFARSCYCLMCRGATFFGFRARV